MEDRIRSICDAIPNPGESERDYRTVGYPTGEFSVRPRGGVAVLYDAFGREVLRAPEIPLFPENGGTFTLREVTIGVQFHWQRKEEETFGGSLVILHRGEGLLTAVNEIPVEDYLLSVVPSEMSGEAPLEFLKAHAIASRSWLVAMLTRGKQGGGAATVRRREGEFIRWYDREDHARFDVCAPTLPAVPGVQRQPSGRSTRPAARPAGSFSSDGQICDARYHNMRRLTEDYATSWEDRSVPYLCHVSDSNHPYPPARTEADAERWILSCPDVYCHTQDPRLLKRILPDYDRETSDFFRWQVSHTRQELEQILREKSGIDFGVLSGLIPLERGPSGRIRLLRIVGSKATIAVGKELEIRRWLSPSHLYSSAFIVSVARDPAGVPTRFTLYGAGWGHGVGLCQIGAAVMAARGFTAEEILRHYFRGTALVKRY